MLTLRPEARQGRRGMPGCEAVDRYRGRWSARLGKAAQGCGAPCGGVPKLGGSHAELVEE